MRRLSCLIALLACLVLALPAFAAPQKADAISGISSEKVLDIVKANKGKLVFINFFATWCPPCREEIPELISIRKAYPADKVVIVTDNLVDYPLTDASITENYVDFVVKVDAIGDPRGIVSGTTRMPKDPIALKIADYGYVLEIGEINISGEASVLIKDQRLVEAYLGSQKKEG